MIVVSALAVVLLAPPAWAQTVYDSFEARIKVDRDGTFVVREAVAVNFLGSRHGIFRDIPVKYVQEDDDDNFRVIDIDVLAVERNGAPEPFELSSFGDQGSFRRIRIGDPDVVVTGPQHYRIRYRVTGALNSFDHHEELFWNVLGGNWEGPFGAATVRVRGPRIIEAICFAGPVGSTDPCAAENGERRPAFSTRFAGAFGTDMSVVVAFAPGAVDVPPPMLEEIWSEEKAFAFTFRSGAGAIGAGVVFLTLLTWFVIRARDRRGHVGLHDPSTAALLDADPDDAPVQFRPPDGLRPAHLGLLDDERIDPVDVGATVLDLARRGHLVIEDRRASQDEDPEWWIVLPDAQPGDTLESFEDRILSGLRIHAGSDDEVSLDHLKGKFRDDYVETASYLYDDAVERGWFAHRPDRVRNSYYALGVLMIVVAVGVVVAALTLMLKIGLLAVPAGVFGLGVLVVARYMPAKEPEGTAALVHARGFKKFIETAERPEMNYAAEHTEFVRFLPFAVAFGAVDSWVRAAEGLDVEAATAGWFVGPHFHSWETMGSSFSDFGSAAASTVAEAPASTSGSGGGFSGGGSSGGGFGGGGGGSW